MKTFVLGILTTLFIAVFIIPKNCTASDKREVRHIFKNAAGWHYVIHTPRDENNLELAKITIVFKNAPPSTYDVEWVEKHANETLLFFKQDALSLPLNGKANPPGPAIIAGMEGEITDLEPIEPSLDKVSKLG